MNLKELQSIVNRTVEHINKHMLPEEIPVLISLQQASIGARASSHVVCANMGIDWENGQFRIEPAKPLAELTHTYTYEQEKVMREYSGRKSYFCPRCNEKLGKEDQFCKRCGQKVGKVKR